MRGAALAFTVLRGDNKVDFSIIVSIILLTFLRKDFRSGWCSFRAILSELQLLGATF